MYENLPAVERLIRLAGMTDVASHKRVTKTGKVVDVESYKRSVSGMNNMDLFKQYQSLSKGQAPAEWEGTNKTQQVRNRLQQVTGEIRKRQESGQWGHSSSSAASKAQKKVARTPEVEARANPNSRSLFESNKDAPKPKVERTRKYETDEIDEKTGEKKRLPIRDESGKEVETSEYQKEVSRVTDILDSIFGSKEKGLAKDDAKIKKYDTQQANGIYEIRENEETGIPEKRFVAYSPERTEQHRKILNDILDKHANVPTEKQAVMSGGLGGAGKGYVLKDFAGINEDDYLVIDPDEMKQEILRRGMGPDVPDLLPMEQAAFIHEESSDLANMLHQIAMKRGMNVILDTTMAAKKDDPNFASSADKKIDMFEAAGYDVRGVFVDVPVEVSIASALDRHLGGVNRFNEGDESSNGDLGGRYVPPSYIEASRMPEGDPTGFNSKNRAVFERLRSEGRFAESEVWDNSDRNREPQLSDKSPRRAKQDEAAKTSSTAMDELKKKTSASGNKVALSAIERLRGTIAVTAGKA